MTKQQDITRLRELACQVRDAAAHPKYRERVRLWTDHNSLRRTRPLVVVGCGRYAAYEYELIQYQCVEPLWRDIEFQLRHKLFKDWIDDDSVLQPWVSVRAVFTDPGWGIQAGHTASSLGREGAYKLAAKPAITPEDVIGATLRKPRHAIDAAATRVKVERVREAIGDILPVHEDRTTPYIGFAADLSYSLGQFIGIERLMMDMYDHPEWLHELLAFLRDGVLDAQAECEAAGDFTALSQHNQVEPYAHETVVPCPNGGPVRRRQLWGFFAAQEYAGISPAMHEEFLFRYQLPIMAQCGLVAYGCCEDLTRKIDMLRPLKSLRRIAVTPWADVAACARQIEDKYVLSWRPNPAPMVCSGFEPETVRKALRAGLDATAGCHTDILLKDIQTVQGEPERLRHWARLARELVEECRL
jgi:hypothetical protein